MIRGYKRPDGRMGVRNHVLVLSCVGCANHVARAIAQRVPGAVALENAKGCGQVGKGLAIMRRCLVNLALNPNVFGTLVVGLGCETTKPLELARRLGEQSAKPVEVITIQGAGGTLAAIEEGVRLASDLAGRATLVPREDMPLSTLVLGTNCGGSDATSGLAANPTIGVVADCVTGAGGTVLLGETTELIGTEHILASRAASAEVGQDVLRIVRDLEEQFVRRGIDVRGANPSPGNMKGGLSTLEEKALGGISKGGTSPITQVVAYGQIPSRRGLVIMDTPGYDIESVSGMAAGGAQVLLFSTGRGNPIGNPLMPVIKVTGNASTYRRMVDNMDFDASGAIGGATSVQDEGTWLLELLERVCNGEPTKAERLGQDDFAIYHNDELWCGCL